VTQVARLCMTQMFTLSCEVVPYVRMTQKSKFCAPAALRYQASQQEIKLAMMGIMSRNDRAMFPPQTPLWVDIDMIVKDRLHTKDSDNLVKAILDAMSKVVYPDDRWVDRITFQRKLGPVNETYIEVGYFVEES